MSSANPLYQYFFTMIQTMVHDILYDPLTDVKFIVPVMAIIIASVFVRHMSVKQTVDSSPTLEKKRERFKLPRDRFNVEVDIILRENYSSYVRAMESDLIKLEQIRKRFKKLLRRYNRYEYMARSSIERREKRGRRMSKSVLNELIDTYSEIKKMNLSAITLDIEEE